MNDVSLQSSFDGGRTFTGRLRLTDRAFARGSGFGSEQSARSSQYPRARLKRRSCPSRLDRHTRWREGARQAGPDPRRRGRLRALGPTRTGAERAAVWRCCPGPGGTGRTRRESSPSSLAAAGGLKGPGRSPVSRLVQPRPPPAAAPAPHRRAPGSTGLARSSPPPPRPPAGWASVGTSRSPRSRRAPPARRGRRARSPDRSPGRGRRRAQRHLAGNSSHLLTGHALASPPRGFGSSS